MAVAAVADAAAATMGEASTVGRSVGWRRRGRQRRRRNACGARGRWSSRWRTRSTAESEQPDGAWEDRDMSAHKEG